MQEVSTLDETEDVQANTKKIEESTHIKITQRVENRTLNRKHTSKLTTKYKQPIQQFKTIRHPVHQLQTPPNEPIQQPH